MRCCYVVDVEVRCRGGVMVRVLVMAACTYMRHMRAQFLGCHLVDGSA